MRREGHRGGENDEDREERTGSWGG